MEQFGTYWKTLSDFWLELWVTLKKVSIPGLKTLSPNTP